MFWDAAVDFGMLARTWLHAQVGRYGLQDGYQTQSRNEASLDSQGWLAGAMLAPCVKGKVRCVTGFNIGYRRLFPSGGGISHPMDRIFYISKPSFWLRGFYIPDVDVQTRKVQNQVAGQPAWNIHSGNGFGFDLGVGLSADM